MATVTLERGSSLIIVKGVPSDICEQCGEYYLSEAVTEKVMAQAEEAVARNAEVEIIRYALKPSDSGIGCVATA